MIQVFERDGKRDKTLWSGQDFWWLHHAIMSYVKDEHHNFSLGFHKSYWMDVEVVNNVQKYIHGLDGEHTGYSSGEWKVVMRITNKALDKVRRALLDGRKVLYTCTE